MKKLWTAIALILGMMGILTACGSSQSSLSNRDEDVQRYAWPLATASPEDTVTQLYAEAFVEEVTRVTWAKQQEEKSGIPQNIRPAFSACLTF